MNRNFAKAFKRTKKGDRYGYCNGYRINIFKRPHGGWACQIFYKNVIVHCEGYFSNYLPTISAAKRWAKFRVVPSCTEDYYYDF